MTVSILDKIRKFGELSYEAGVHERDGFLEKADEAKRCFQEIVKLMTVEKVEWPEN